jgi:hypothetical protein
MAQHHRQLLHNLEIETFKARTGDALGPATAGLGRGGEKGEGSVVSGSVDQRGEVALQHMQHMQDLEHKLFALQQVKTCLCMCVMCVCVCACVHVRACVCVRAYVRASLHE